MIDLFFRCFSRERWITVATNRGIYSAEGILQPGYFVDELGFVVLQPAVIVDGEVVTPAVIDTWHSVNLRIQGQAAVDDEDTVYPDDVAETGPWRFIRSKLARFVREQGTLITSGGIRRYQFGSGDNRIQLIDPRDVVTPQRVWLGGMFL